MSAGDSTGISFTTTQYASLSTPMYSLLYFSQTQFFVYSFLYL